MADTPSLMSIGEFSALARISVRMLRHYDAHDVLTPAAVDPSSGYRRYSGAQLEVAARIRRLRDVGFGVAAIAALLAVHGTPAYESALRLQRDTLAADVDAARQRLVLLDRLLESEGALMSDITVRRETTPARTIVTLRGTVPGYAAEGQLWARFLPELQRQGIPLGGAGGCIEHDPTFQEGDVDESVFVEVPPGTAAAAPLQAVAVPAQDTVVARVTGPYHRLAEAHTAIAEYLDAEGLRPAPRTPEGVPGKHYNVYLNDPSRTPEDELLTDLYLPVG